LLSAGLIDEMILTIIPKGIPLFGRQAREQQYQIFNAKTFSTGYEQINKQ
jgi:dihydrofolate reductase